MGATLLVVHICTLSCAMVTDRAVFSPSRGLFCEHGAHVTAPRVSEPRVRILALSAVRGGGSDSEEHMDGMTDSNSELAGFSEADRTISRAEDLYLSAVTGRRGKRKASGYGDGSWSSCLKAVTNFIFTGRQAKVNLR